MPARGYEGGVVLVSHDRYLLESWARRVIRIAGDATRVCEGGYRDLADRIESARAEPPESPFPTKTARRKALRARADARPARRKRRFWKLEDLEAAIIEKEARLEALEASFADPAAARDGETMKRLVQEREALTAELAELNEEWEGWG